MKNIFLLILLMAAISVSAQELYVKTFGKTSDQPILFLHGGPGYNAAGFEISTAQKLADEGFFVIVYDRRGEGRSTDKAAKFNYSESFADIDQICQKYKIRKVNLMGHSFGGILAVMYAEKNPEKVGSVLLVSAPVSLQESFKTIQNASRKIYEAKGDKTSLDYLDVLDKMDHSSMQYATFTFMHAMQNGFYQPKNATPEAKAIYAAMAADPNFKYVQEMSREAPMGFWTSEKYTTLDLTSNIKNLKTKKVKVFGIYGKEDGLYSPEQVAALSAIIGNENTIYLDGASHNVFIDQQPQFLSAVKKFLKS